MFQATPDNALFYHALGGRSSFDPRCKAEYHTWRVKQGALTAGIVVFCFSSQHQAIVSRRAEDPAPTRDFYPTKVKSRLANLPSSWECVCWPMVVGASREGWEHVLRTCSICVFHECTRDVMLDGGWLYLYLSTHTCHLCYIKV